MEKGEEEVLKYENQLSFLFSPSKAALRKIVRKQNIKFYPKIMNAVFVAVAVFFSSVYRH